MKHSYQISINMNRQCALSWTCFDYEFEPQLKSNISRSSGDFLDQ